MITSLTERNCVSSLVTKIFFQSVTIPTRRLRTFHYPNSPSLFFPKRIWPVPTLLFLSFVVLKNKTQLCVTLGLSPLHRNQATQSLGRQPPMALHEFPICVKNFFLPSTPPPFSKRLVQRQPTSVSATTCSSFKGTYLNREMFSLKM